MKNYYYEAQADLIKKWSGSSNFVWAADDENICYTSDGFVCYIIPRKFLMIDERVFDKRKPAQSILLTAAYGKGKHEPAVIVGTIISSGKTLVRLSDISGFGSAYVDQRIFKPFMKQGEFTYRIVGDTFENVQIYWCDKLFAVVFQTKIVKENEKNV